MKQKSEIQVDSFLIEAQVLGLDKEEKGLPKTFDGVPLIRIPSLQIEVEESARERLIASLEATDWVVFTSANGVHATASLLGDKFPESIRKFLVAAVGPATAAALKLHLVDPQLVSAESHGSALGKELLAASARPDTNYLLLRGSNASPELPAVLATARATDIPVYRAVSPPMLRATVREMAATRVFEKHLDGTIVTSIAAFENLLRCLREERNDMIERLQKAPAFVIGPKTEEGIRALGFREIITAPNASREELYQMVIRFLEGRPQPATK